MRRAGPLRGLTLLLVAPVVVVTASATAFIAVQVRGDREENGRLARAASRTDGMQQANGSLGSEIVYLVAAGAFEDDLPRELASFEAGAASLAGSMSHEQVVAMVAQVDALGAQALGALDRLDVRVPPPVRVALGRIPDEELERLEAGRTTGLDVGAYAESYSFFVGRTQEDAGQRERAQAELVERAARPELWRDPVFLLPMAGVWAVALSVVFWVRRRILARVARVERELDVEREQRQALAGRNEQLLDLVGVARRIASELDMGAVCAALAEEAMVLAEADFALVSLVEGDRLVPVSTVGGVEAGPIRVDTGFVGRAVDAATTSTAVVRSDEALPGEPGPLALLVAPLVAARQVLGAIVAGRRGERLFAEDHEGAMRLLALTAGAAVEAARLHGWTAELAELDELTGLYNRRRLQSDLGRAIGARSADDRPVAFAMVDVDHFKTFNDTHGHPAGDVALREVAALLRASLRDSDVAYRFGGEEFSVLLPGTGADEARLVAERIRSSVEGRAFPGEEALPGGRLTVSVGLAVGARGDARALVEAADAALYEAKRAGRNRVVVGEVVAGDREGLPSRVSQDSPSRVS